MRAATLSIHYRTRKESRVEGGISRGPCESKMIRVQYCVQANAYPVYGCIRPKLNANEIDE